VIKPEFERRGGYHRENRDAHKELHSWTCKSMDLDALHRPSSRTASTTRTGRKPIRGNHRQATGAGSSAVSIPPARHSYNIVHKKRAIVTNAIEKMMAKTASPKMVRLIAAPCPSGFRPVAVLSNSVARRYVGPLRRT
jgi:hypothetical protein